MTLKTLYIRGWKDLAEVTGFHERTLRRWHYERCKLVVTRMHPHSKTSRWVVTIEQVNKWLMALGIDFRNQKMP